MPKYFREGHESVTIAEHLNIISMIFPTAKIDRPANLAMDDVYLNSIYSKAVDRSAKDSPSAMKTVITAMYFPCWQHSGKTINKGHTSGALASEELKKHILQPLQK